MSEQRMTNERAGKVQSIREAVAPPELMGGKLPPQALDLEQAVLGAMLIDKNAVNAAIDILDTASFYKDSHGLIFGAIQALFQNNDPIDLLTVTSTLRKSGELEVAGGAYYISQLTTRVSSAANVEYHARIVAQKYIQRELIRVSNDIIKDAYDETSDVFELLDKAETSLFQVAQGNIRKNFDKLQDVVKEALEQINAASEKTGGISGVPSGFVELDRITSGWQSSDMIVLAARPGMGKTAFVLSMARNIAVDAGMPVALFSLEMASVQLVNRLIASETQINAGKLRKGDLKPHEFEQLHQRIGNLADAPIFIDDTAQLSVFELRAKCRRLKSQQGISIVIIDYLQLMTAGGDNKGGNREQEISTISRSIKSIAKELSVPIIALSQLSRSVETRGGDKKPMLSDLRESGAIEQDADIVCFIYRGAYYGMLNDEDGNSLDGIGELIIAKHRNGSLDTVKMKFIPELAKFTDLESFGELPADFNPNSGMKPNVDFETNTMTIGSKMNNEPNDEFASDGAEPSW